MKQSTLDPSKLPRPNALERLKELPLQSQKRILEELKRLKLESQSNRAEDGRN